MIHVKAQALIEPHFLHAKMQTAGGIAKVEKPQVLVFLEFVDPLSGQKDDGNMGLPAFDAGGGMRIKSGFGHGPANVLESLGGFHDGRSVMVVPKRYHFRRLVSCRVPSPIPDSDAA